MNDLEDNLKRAEAAQDHFTAIAILDRLCADSPENLDYRCSLKGIIYYWQGYVTLMKHWQELDPGALLHVGYEALVKDPEQQIAALLEYCGLSAEPGCFGFYESVRPVLTPSASQVRSPMTDRSIGSGLKYESYIKTSLPALAEIKRKTREVLGV
jgi:hypothetical protein